MKDQIKFDVDDVILINRAIKDLIDMLACATRPPPRSLMPALEAMERTIETHFARLA